ncbi:hypothetical protein F2P81_007406 [Scophthalmus maximus]|uniref:Uncharacterized protein n=1 Tax=Scophthalmus maximus TaxID=52904 RepID=A0A6A4TAR9_SCOMX|nr:hypothetical protein F2P81_007406 [Scophthalmus maximus]
MMDLFARRTDDVTVSSSQVFRFISAEWKNQVTFLSHAPCRRSDLATWQQLLGIQYEIITPDKVLYCANTFVVISYDSKLKVVELSDSVVCSALICSSMNIELVSDLL